MARLPTVGGDKGDWGTILNDYLGQSLADDGSLKANSVAAPQLKPNSVTGVAIADDSIEEIKLSAAVRTKLSTHAEIPAGSITNSMLADQAVSPNKASGFGTANGFATLDANARLLEDAMPNRLRSGELTATFASAAQGSKADTALQRADLTKESIGLDKVDNTSDLEKPVSPAQAAAIDLKANTSDVYDKATADGRFAPGGVPSGITATHTRGYSPRLSLYNLKPTHFRRTRARLASVRANAGHFKIGVIAHSMGAGVGGTVGTSGFPEFLVSMLDTAGYQSAGTGMVPCYRGASAIDPHWSYGAGWSSFGGSSSLYWNSSTTAPLTYTSSVAGTTVNVYLGQTSSSGSVNIAIDGAAAVLVTPGNGVNTVFTYAASGLANTTHTVSITRNNASVFVFGVEILKSPSGVRLYNGGIGGQRSAGIADTNWYSTASFSGASSRWAADLNIIGPIMANDGFAAVAATAWKANVQTAIDNVSGDKIIVIDTPVNTLNLDAYRNAAYELADANDVPLLDMTDRWGAYTIASSYSMMSDGTHPNSTGYSDWARALFNAIGI